MKEIWKPIVIGGIDYTGIYEVSNKGRVRSVTRLIDHVHGGKSKVKGKLMRPSLNNKGYPRVSLRAFNARKVYLISRLVTTAFKGKIPKGCVAHHKDTNPLNNNDDNLEIRTHRSNLSIEQTEKSGLPVGVFNAKRKFGARIVYNNKTLYLGLYKTVEKAAKAYQIALELIETKDLVINSKTIKAAMIDYKRSIGSNNFNKRKKKTRIAKKS